MNEIDTTDPRADYPPDRMFVNQGTDRRIPGALGTQLALIQRLQSFKSAEPPQIRVEQWAGGALFETQTWPNGRQPFPTADGGRGSDSAGGGIASGVTRTSVATTRTLRSLVARFSIAS